MDKDLWAAEAVFLRDEGRRTDKFSVVLDTHPYPVPIETAVDLLVMWAVSQCPGHVGEPQKITVRVRRNATTPVRRYMASAARQRRCVALGRKRPGPGNPLHRTESHAGPYGPRNHLRVTGGPGPFGGGRGGFDSRPGRKDSPESVKTGKGKGEP